MISAQQLAISYQCPLSRVAPWADVLNKAMAKYEINTSLRIAHFVAQIGHESGRLRYVHEIASGAAYDNRKDLGNTRPEAIAVTKKLGTTPGKWWRGHGLIQTTGYDNHVACGKALGLDLINHPELLMVPEHAAMSAAWYWHNHHLNELADMDLLIKITQIINGGQNGISDRRSLLTFAKSALGI